MFVSCEMRAHSGWISICKYDNHYIQYKLNPIGYGIKIKGLVFFIKGMFYNCHVSGALREIINSNYDKDEPAFKYGEVSVQNLTAARMWRDLWYPTILASLNLYNKQVINFEDVLDFGIF